MTKRKSDELVRCDWQYQNHKDDLFLEYHDTEWGNPVYDSVKLFEMLCLSGQQAGLSWQVILRKRENYRKAFHNFNPIKVSKMTTEDVEELLNNPGILRNKRKIESIINNARSYLKMKENNEDFSKYIWSFVNNKPIINRWKSLKDIPTESEHSKTMAKSLKKKKFSFIGSTVCYAYMQSCGLINDHQKDCFVHKGFKRRKAA